MSLREEFPIFKSKTYINSCSYGALSHDVRAAYEQYLNDRDIHGSHWEHWVGMLEDLRARMASLLNAESDEIALTSSLSEGLNALASSLTYTPERNKIVITDFDFPTTAQIWFAQQKRGAKVVQVAEDNATKSLLLESFEKAIDDSTLLVSIPYVCYRNGSTQDIEPIIKLARKHGAMVFLDSYQAVGAIPVDVKALDVDFLAGGMLKYLLSTAGTGYLYVRKPLIEKLVPTTSGWFSQRDIHAMDHTQNDPSPTARRFESGTPNVANVYAAIAGLKIVEKLGVANIQNEVSSIIAALKAKTLENGFKLGIDQQRHSPMVTIQSNDMYGLVAKLEEDNIVTSCRDDNLRVSPHFYNNLDDVDTLFESLLKNQSLLARE
jgi:selenocysteine lyase/cysteine desulfurase